MVGSLGFDKSFALSSRGRSGGLGIFWNNEIKVEILGYSCYHIDVSVEEDGHEKWRMTCIYGEAQTHLRHENCAPFTNFEGYPRRKGYHVSGYYTKNWSWRVH